MHRCLATVAVANVYDKFYYQLMPLTQNLHANVGTSLHLQQICTTFISSVVPKEHLHFRNENVLRFVHKSA